nr:TerB family tellurite resistance protein [Euryarchaeota archaeon]
MLPDTLHELPRDERFAYAKLLAYMINIDDEVTIDEMTVFEQRLGTALLSPSQRNSIRQYLKNPPTLDECLADLGDVSGRLALRDAALMTAADGSIDEVEQIALETIARHLNLDDDIIDKLLDWVLTGFDWMQDGLNLLNVE